MLCGVSAATPPTRPDVIWRKFEELTKLSSRTNKEKLDAFGHQLRADDAVAYLVSYAGRVSCRREALARARLVRKYLVSNGGVDPSRIKVIDRGFHDDWVVELWLAPKLAPPLRKKSISDVGLDLSRNQVKVRGKCNRAAIAF
jgi:hypothetical protein